MDAFGCRGMMVLPQAFGSIYLGETFCSYISVGNHTEHDVTHVVIKAELQTERQRIVLSDNMKTPLEALPAGGRYDFIVEHDIKELGAHTLVCSATYIDTGEQKYLPQYFKFMASNPLSVRTKVRTIKDSTFLEACIENGTKAPLFLDHVRFEPAPSWQVTVLEPEEEDEKISAVGSLSDLFQPVTLVRANGGTRHFVYQFRRTSAHQQEPQRLEGGNSLGKLEITWRTTLGELGRLQTQQILGNPLPRKEVELRLVELPTEVFLETPFPVCCRLKNCTDREVGPLRITMSRDEGLPSSASSRAIVVSGSWALTFASLGPHETRDFTLSLVALAGGVQRISGIGVQDVRDGKPYDTMPSAEVFVQLGQ
eukprot:TRINITY_DN3424_c0_g1_i1.p1 TRINITY_DN3424_c0_g1~~TRINITY_DN3424_c0_g1_i1.p1  ORF type:complete len:393 (-),score=66.37 TRINITY_DN3424_c0_g1_i1:157-1260(-)